MKIYKEQQEWLNHYYELYGHYRVQLFVDKPFKWMNYATTEYEEFIKWSKCLPNHREIMSDEIVVDVDGERRDNLKLFNRLKEAFTNLKITFHCWQSGGDGYHFHLFYPDIRNLNGRDRTIMKKLLKSEITKGVSKPKDLKSHVCQSNPLLIQCEKGRHRKGAYKTFIYKQENGQNKVPRNLWKKLEETRKNWDKEKENWKGVEMNGLTPNYIKFFWKGEDFKSINDGRYRAMFLLSSYFIRKGYTKEETYLKLKEWNSYSLRGYFEDYKIRQSIDTNNGKAGFPFAKQLLEELGRIDVIRK